MESNNGACEPEPFWCSGVICSVCGIPRTSYLPDGLPEQRQTSTLALGSIQTGYTAGGGGPDMMAPIVEKVRRWWSESGRGGEPRLVALSYFALGPRAEEGSARYLNDYYGYLGEWADRIAESAPTTPEALKELAGRFRDIGVDELILDPTISELDQVDRLADSLL